mmetsp:Transcript_14409/g.36150  ORF Transcript_14409/g.36150 Transcript_14409/m.36150 type:complete len:471 (-) Transcript_14409:919-2331(-)
MPHDPDGGQKKKKPALARDTSASDVAARWCLLVSLNWLVQDNVKQWFEWDKADKDMALNLLRTVNDWKEAYDENGRENLWQFGFYVGTVLLLVWYLQSHRLHESNAKDIQDTIKAAQNGQLHGVEGANQDVFDWIASPYIPRYWGNEDGVCYGFARVLCGGGNPKEERAASMVRDGMLMGAGMLICEFPWCAALTAFDPTCGVTTDLDALRSMQRAQRTVMQYCVDSKLGATEEIFTATFITPSDHTRIEEIIKMGLLKMEQYDGGVNVKDADGEWRKLEGRFFDEDNKLTEVGAAWLTGKRHRYGREKISKDTLKMLLLLKGKSKENINHTTTGLDVTAHLPDEDGSRAVHFRGQFVTDGQGIPPALEKLLFKVKNSELLSAREKEVWEAWTLLRVVPKISLCIVTGWPNKKDVCLSTMAQSHVCSAAPPLQRHMTKTSPYKDAYVMEKLVHEDMRQASNRDVSTWGGR